MQKENLNLTNEWDKTFPKSDKTDHRKVTFVNRYGITLAGDLYTPKAAHSCYFGKDAFADMVNGSKYTENKELLLIPGATHTDLYDGGGKNAIPFDKLTAFFTEYLK